MKRQGILHIWTGVLILVLLAGRKTQAQEQKIENDFQSRLEVEVNYKPLKRITLSITPEVRYTNNLLPDIYLINLGASCNILKYLNLETTYRFGMNPRENKSTQHIHRYSLGLKGKVKIERFTPSLRVRYTNDADDETTDEQFLRYKANLKYDIPNCKFSPKVASEAFQLLDDNGGLYKMRYTLGGSYKLMKNHYLKAAYKLDYFNMQYKNRHIFEIGYKLNF
jgi:hypothetical protein